MAVRKRRERKTTEEVWREIIQECQRSGLSPDVFCEKERYSIEAFWLFHERLFGDSDQNDLGSSNHDRPRPESPGLKVRGRPRTLLTTDPIGNRPVNRSPSIADKNAEDSTIAILEIILTTGVLLRVTSNCSPQLLRSVVSVLEEVP